MSFIKALTNRNSFKSFRKSFLTFSGVICTVGGFVADVLQPIAPFISYLFYFATAATALFAILYFTGKKNLIGAFLLSLVAMIFTGGVWFLQSGDKKAQKQGVVAAKVPAVSDLQKALGLIDEKLDALQATTGRIEEKSDAIQKSLDELKEGIAAGGAEGGIIAQPTSPEDHYHNARIHELGGDYTAARRSYREYFKAGETKLDPYLRYLSFLKAQEGRVGALETFNELLHRSPSELGDYARILLLPRDKRVAALQRVATEKPGFAPAYYHLSLEFSERRLGGQTLGDLRKERDALLKFAAADAAGGLLRHFFDQEQASEWRSDAAARLATAQQQGEVLDAPVSLSWLADNTNWRGTVAIAEPAVEIFWNFKGEAPRTTGKAPFNDPKTGQAAASTAIELPLSQADAVIEIRYLDTNQIEQGPFSFEFEGRRSSDDGNQKLLELTASSWLNFREYEGSLLLYTSHLMTYRGGIAEIRYGIDKERPDQILNFPAYDGAGTAPITGEEPLFLPVPAETKFATVQLVYKSGDVSEVRRFER